MRLRKLALLPLFALHACTCGPSSPEGASCAPFAEEADAAPSLDTCTPGGGECTPGSTYACATGQQISSSLECPTLFQTCCVPSSALRDGSANDAAAFGLCNGAECAAACACAPPGECLCDDAGASDAESSVDADADTDVAIGDAEAEAEAGDPGAVTCGVITCLAHCECVGEASSECLCP
jgi:hypothetical protein